MTQEVAASLRATDAGLPLLKLAGITKRFGGLVANDAITMSVSPGEVVAMLGENGAGKSTLMKIIYGLVRADEGTITVSGHDLQISSPRDAMAAGIGMVTQEFSLVETMTVTENVALSGVRFGHVNVREIRRQVMDAMERVGVSIEPERLVSSLSIGERQRVEIVKALFHECRVLILDEPTAVLTPADVRALFSTITRLRATGLGVLFVSHKLREVAEISDRVVVLRRGKLVGERVTTDVDPEALAGLMMGATSAAAPEATASSTTAIAVGLPVGPKDISEGIPEGIPGKIQSELPAADLASANETARTILALDQVTVVRNGRAVLDGVSLEAHAGEIVGIAGISGNGQTELMEALSGTIPVDSGTIAVDGTDLTRSDVATRLRSGFGRLTEDRRGSVIPQMSVEYNLVMENLDSFTNRGLLDKAAIRRHAEAMIERFDIRARPQDAMATLSGGNVQKVLLARALARNPKALVVAQPTRGLDIGAYRYVHGQLKELRDTGAAVLVISEDLDELHGLCDRIAVLFRGRIVGDLSASEATTERLGVMMTGQPVSI